MSADSKYPFPVETRRNKNCDCHHSMGNNVIFKSNYGNLGAIDVTFTEGTSTQTFNQPIASVTIDTTCENVKNIIIEFVGILNVTTTVSATSTLTFTLFRMCNGTETPQPIASTAFFVADIFGGVTTSHTLVFKFPFSNDCCEAGCCTYILDLTDIFNLDFGTITYAINGTLSALAIVSS